MVRILLMQFFLLFSFSVFSQNNISLPPPINSVDFKTVSPYISYDGKHIVFIEKTKNAKILVESKLNMDGSWSKPISIDAINNFDSVAFEIESPTYNQDASIIYFSLIYDKKDANSDIYFSEKIKGKWQKPKKMPKPINSEIDEFDPFISADGKFFYFTRRYKNDDLKKFECFSIYVSEKRNGIWTKPKLLPTPVNDGCDRTPRVATDGTSLYFTSIRNGGKTGGDIYFAKKITKNAWMSPIPIDTLYNEEDESFPSIPLAGDFLYFQQGKGRGNKRTEHIVKTKLSFEFMPEKTVRIHGIVTDLNDNKPLSAKINVVDPNTSIILFDAKTDGLTGEYSFFLPKGKKYRIDVYKEGYSHSFFNYSTEGLSKFTEEKKDIKLYSEINLVLSVYDVEIFEPLSANVQVIDMNSNKKLDIKITEKDKGRFYITLPIDTKCLIEAEKTHYEKNSFELDLTEVVQFSEFERDLELQVKKVDYVINLSDSETGEGVETLVEITNLTTNEKIVKKVKTGKDGKLSIKLRDGTKYEISVTPKGYAFYNTTVDLVDEDAEHLLDAKLDPLKKATKIELNDINFESNSADINNSSFDELKMLIKLLKTNPQIKIELSAHTDDVGSKAYNLKLSFKRANTVRDYLLGNGVPENQIVAKGYGESKPAYLPVNLEENRAKNRRVELEVLEVNE